MKIAILSSASAGGAGIAAYRIFEAFKATTEHEVDFLDMNTLGQVNLEVSPTESATNGKITNTHFTMDYANDVREWLVDFLSKYDVLNVQWASYLISLSEILELAKRGKKILFTLHDFHYITGGCHYPAGCLGYLKNCIGCPQVNEQLFSQKAVISTNNIKREIFNHPNVHLSAPSNFIVDNAIRSGIVPSERAHVLRNTYKPLEEFDPNAKSEEKSILLIADSFDEQRKGLALAVDSLKHSAESFKKTGMPVTLHLVGGLDQEVIKRLDGTGIKVVTHGHIKEHEKLVDIFKKCHFILTCSYEDNWPNILVESGSYGCIPIVGKWHGCEEFVDAIGWGYIANSYAVECFASTVVESLIEPIQIGNLIDYVKNVRDMHSSNGVVNNYISAINDIGVNGREGVSYKDDSCTTCFSQNHSAAMHATLITNKQLGNIELIKSPFGKNERELKYACTYLIGILDYKLGETSSKHEYGISQLKFTKN